MKSLADMHMHTIMSGHAYGTIWVHEKNLKMIGITEHGSGIRMPMILVQLEN